MSRLRPAMFFFFNDTATTEICPLSLHAALPISGARARTPTRLRTSGRRRPPCYRHRAEQLAGLARALARSEEHTSELQSLAYLVCRLLLEKKKIMDESSHEPARDAPIPDSAKAG